MITRDNPYYGQVQLLVNILPIVGRVTIFSSNKKTGSGANKDVNMSIGQLNKIINGDNK